MSFSRAVAQLSLVNVTNIPCRADAVAISGHYLYVAGHGANPPADSSGLRIFDLSNPAMPLDVGYNDGLGYCETIAVSSSFVYTVQNGLTILDSSNPTNPISVGQIAGPWVDVTVDGHLVYLSQWVQPYQVSIYDVSNPASPASLGHIQTSGDAPGPVAVKGSYAYVPVSFGGLLVADISNPANPVTDGATTDNSPIWNAVACGDYAYASGVSNSLAVYSIVNPTNPTCIFSSWPFRCASMALCGNYLLTTSGRWVYSWEESNPTNTLSLAELDIVPSGNGGSLHAIAVSHAYAYVAGGGYLTVVSLGTPSAPLLMVATTSTNTAILSWPTPSLAFAVQNNLGLNPANWVTLTNQPVVVASQNQVTVPAPNGTTFYRLVLQ